MSSECRHGKNGCVTVQDIISEKSAISLRLSSIENIYLQIRQLIIRAIVSLILINFLLNSAVSALVYFLNTNTCNNSNLVDTSASIDFLD